MSECSVCESLGKFTDVSKLCPMHAREFDIESSKASIVSDVNRLRNLIGEGATNNFIKGLI